MTRSDDPQDRSTKEEEPVVRHIIVIVTLLIVSDLGAHNRPPTATRGDTTKALLVENTYLRAQLDELRRSDDRLLSTVHWALGITVGIGLALLGFGWWQNMRVYDRDKETLSKQLFAELDQRLPQVVDAKVTTAIQALEQRLQKRFEQLREGILLAWVDQSFDDVREHKKAGDRAAALGSYAHLLRWASLAGLENTVADSLDGIGKLLATDLVPTATVTASLSESLEGVPAKFKVDAEAIRDILRKKRAAP